MQNLWKKNNTSIVWSLGNCIVAGVGGFWTKAPGGVGGLATPFCCLFSFVLLTDPWDFRDDLFLSNSLEV